MVMAENQGPTIEELEVMHDEGNLEYIRSSLENFVFSHRNNIFGYKKILETVYSQEISLDCALRLYILKTRSVNFHMDLRDQLEEIKKEVWIRHENHDPKSEDEIALEWAKKYGEKWREYRVMSILYFYDKNKNHYLDLLVYGEKVSCA